jgi:hypothetical protein
MSRQDQENLDLYSDVVKVVGICEAQEIEARSISWQLYELRRMVNGNFVNQLRRIYCGRNSVQSTGEATWNDNDCPLFGE